MKNKFLIIITTVILASALIVTTVLAATINPTTRTATTGAFYVDWDNTNPEAIVDLRWNGSANLTNTAVVAGCSDALEYFGNSWVSENEGTPSFVFSSLVGWGTTGTWSSSGHNKVAVQSSSTGCPASAGLDVSTKYQFFDHGPAVNKIKVQRKFSFGSTPFTYNVRPYIPRLYPLDGYTQVLHPDASGTSLLTEDSSLCDFGCQVTDWNGDWFAIHNPATGQGMVVRRGSSTPAALWVDQDGASYTNSSSVLLLAPSGGFTGNVSETEFLCFYDSSTWSPSLSTPPGC
jgi:hypothetical protein